LKNLQIILLRKDKMDARRQAYDDRVRRIVAANKWTQDYAEEMEAPYNQAVKQAKTGVMPLLEFLEELKASNRGGYHFYIYPFGCNSSGCFGGLDVAPLRSDESRLKKYGLDSSTPQLDIVFYAYSPGQCDVRYRYDPPGTHYAPGGIKVFPNPKDRDGWVLPVQEHDPVYKGLNIRELNKVFAEWFGAVEGWLSRLTPDQKNKFEVGECADAAIKSALEWLEQRLTPQEGQTTPSRTDRDLKLEPYVIRL
jgi:hypothetical protein